MSTQRLKESQYYRKHRRHKGGRSEEQISSHRMRRKKSNFSTPRVSFYNSEEYERGAEKNLNSEQNSWSRDKLKNELSSFIHEFTYLTQSSDNLHGNNEEATCTQPSSNHYYPSTTSYTPQKAPHHTKHFPNRPYSTKAAYKVYALTREERDTPFERDSMENEVERGDKKRLAAYNKQTTESDYEPHGRVIRKGRHVGIQRVTVKKSRSKHKKPSRSISTRKVRRRFSKFRASSSRGRRRARSSRSWKKCSRSRRRIRSRSSAVKDIPLKYRPLKKKSKCKRSKSRVRSKSRCRSKSRSRSKCRSGSRVKAVVIRKEKPPPVLRTVEPLPEPSIVTLFPKSEHKWRRDPGLPCNCKACKNKYESLVRLCLNPCIDPCLNPRPQPYTRACTPCRPRFMVPCAPYRPPFCYNPRPNPCNRTWGCCPTPCSSPCYTPCPTPCSTPCPTPCYTPCPTPCPSPCPPPCPTPCSAPCSTPRPTKCSAPCYNNCRQPTLTKVFRSSVHFRLDSVDQCLNTDITQYFHSILNKTVGC